jgi:hypothetical protein
MSGILVILLVVGVATVLLVSQGASGSVLVAAAGIPPAERPLLIRFIDRSRRFRRAGAIASLVLAAGLAVALAAERDGGGVGGRVELAVLASIGLGGSILGSMAAELFRLRHPSGPRVASLSVRDPGSYRDPVVDRRERVLLVLSGVAAALSLVVAAAPVRGVTLLAATFLLVGLRRWVTARVALRGRPVLPAELEAADDRVRSLAISAGLGRPIVTLAALLGSMQWAGLTGGSDSAGTMPDLVDIAGVVGSLGLLGAAGVWWWRNRSFGFVPRGSAAHPLRRLAWLRFAAVTSGVVLLAGLVIALRGG